MEQTPCTFCRFVRYFAVGLFVVAAGILMWQIREMNDRTMQEISSMDEQRNTSNTPSLLAAPGVVIAMQDQIGLLIPDRTCDKTYIIERSIDGQSWVTVGTTTFGTSAHGDPALKSCENSFVDTENIPIEAVRGVYYRYGELGENGSVIRTSAAGKIEFEQGAPIDIDPEQFMKFVSLEPKESWSQFGSASRGFTFSAPRFYKESAVVHSVEPVSETGLHELAPEDRFRLMVEPGDSYPLTVTSRVVRTEAYKGQPVIDYADMTTPLTPVKRELTCGTKRFTESRYEQGGPEMTEVHIDRFTFPNNDETVEMTFTYSTDGYCRKSRTCADSLQEFEQQNEALKCGILESLEFVAQ